MDNSYEVLELDELYWYIEEKSRKETRENVYLVTAVSRQPRQIVGFDVAQDKSPPRIQAMVDAHRLRKSIARMGIRDILT